MVRTRGHETSGTVLVHGELGFTDFSPPMAVLVCRKQSLQYVCVVVQKVSLHCSMCTSQDDLRSVKLQHYKRALFVLNILTKLGDTEAIS